MMTLVMSLLLCWTPNTEPDLLGYWVTSAERHITGWVVCPCEPGVPCPQHVLCPEYSPLQWVDTFTGDVPQFRRDDCANEPGSICYYRHPRAQDFRFNLSEQPQIPNPVPGGCP